MVCRLFFADSGSHAARALESLRAGPKEGDPLWI
ncbi:hypothetical protein BXY51_000742 [Actinoplanes cyaneus]|nr:hypothetical protein [Actinoplanes cyaneus]